jgi:hypothetical protein
MRNELDYQDHLIRKIQEHVLPGCRVLKNDPGYIQGVPDLTILNGKLWAWLEVKRKSTSWTQANQQFYIDWASRNAFGAFISPDNEDEVLDALQQALEPGGPARLPKRK